LVKVCWDNLEKVKYKNGKYYIGKEIYDESENICRSCGEISLKKKRRKYIDFCSLSCKSLFYSNKMTKETKNKISNSIKGEKHYSYNKFKNINCVSFDKFKYFLESFHDIRNNNEVLEVRCTYCNKWYKPTHIEAHNRLKGINGNGGRNLYCSEECKQECPTYKQRSYPKSFKPTTSREVQPELRKLVFERDNWSCVKCSNTNNLHCHHIDPVINNPIESADLDKCITLCKECHKEIHKREGCKNNQLKC